MKKFHTILSALLLTSVMTAQASTPYEMRVHAQGIKAASASGPAPVAPEKPAPAPAPVPPQVSLSPNVWDFGTVAAGQSVTKAFTLSNTGTSPASLSFGSISTPFTTANESCAANLLPNASCTFTVSYLNNQAESSSNASLSIALGGGASPLTATFTGATAVTPGTLQLGVPSVTYSNNATTASTPGGKTADVPFANSKTSGTWYWEMQSTGKGSLNTYLPGGGGYYVDLLYRDRNVFGSGGVTPSGRAALQSSSTARYGFAADIGARTMTIYDVTTCTVVTTVKWASAGAVRPAIGFRTFDSATTITAFFAQSGKTCIPAGYRWWSGS